METKKMNFDQMEEFEGGSFAHDFTCGIGGSVNGAIIGGVIGGPVGFVVGITAGTLISMGCAANE